MSTLLILQHQGHTQQHPVTNVSSSDTTSRTHSTTSSNKHQLFWYNTKDTTTSSNKCQLLIQHKGHTQQHPAINVSSFHTTTSRTHSTTSKNNRCLFWYYSTKETQEYPTTVSSLICNKYNMEESPYNIHSCWLFWCYNAKDTQQHQQLLVLSRLWQSQYLLSKDQPRKQNKWLKRFQSRTYIL